MKKTIIFTVLLSLTTFNVAAQDYIDHLQEQRSGQGTVKVVESKEIDTLVNGAAESTTVATKPAAPSQHAAAPTHSQHATEPRENAHSVETDSPTQPEAVVDTRRKVMRGHKVQGYRVQVFSGGNSRADKNKAQQAGNAMKEAFPTLPVFVHFYSPRWVCRIGNFVDKSEANACLRQVRSLGYSQACIIKGTITVKSE